MQEKLSRLDQMIITRYVERNVVWPFEYENIGTRFTIVRMVNAASLVLLAAATLVSNLIPETHLKMLYVGVGVGGAYIIDRWLVGSEWAALARGGEPNRYRDRHTWRMYWLLLPFLSFIMGLLVFPDNYIEGILRVLMSCVSAFGLYVFCADPVPRDWTPPPKRLAW